MKQVLVEGNGHDLESLQELFRTHGIAASAMSDNVCLGEGEDFPSENRYYQSIFENAPVGIFRTTVDGKIISANPAVARMLKYDSAEELIQVVNRSNIATVIYVDPGHRREITEAVLRHDGWQIFEERFRCKDGGVITCNFHLRPVRTRDGHVELDGFIEDISERKRVEEELRRTNEMRSLVEKRILDSLAEKEVLLKEIHHRVKNNLQVVSSLLFLQSRKIRDPELATHFIESQNRIYSIALAHELLYQSGNLSDIRLPVYVRNLVGQVELAFKPRGKKVACRVEIEDLKMDIEQVVPCGLLITELLSNALKHAFPEDRSGTVEVDLRREDELLSLTVRDNGIGLPADLDIAKAETLGLQLIRALAVQLDGTLTCERQDGTHVRVVFPFQRRGGS